MNKMRIWDCRIQIEIGVSPIKNQNLKIKNEEL